MSDWKLDEEFGPFTAKEVRHAFNAFDLDNNRFVGAAELRHIYRSLGENVKDEEINEMIAMVDDDGDGQVDLDEFQKMIFRYAEQIEDSDDEDAPHEEEIRQLHEQDQQKSNEEAMKRKAELEGLLHRLNIGADKITEWLNGYMESKIANQETVSYDEFTEYLALDDSKWSEQLFTLFDANGDQNANMREFLTATVNYAKGWKLEDKIRFLFAVFDDDGGGFLEKEELLKILKANYMATSFAQVRRKAEAVLRSADKDGDGEVSYDEFVAVCQKYPNLIFPKIERELD